LDLDKKPVYTLGLKHIICYMLGIFSEKEFGPSFYLKIMSWLNHSTHYEMAEKFSKAKIEQVIKDIGLEVEPAYFLSEDSSLLDAVEIMVEKKVNRIIVQDKNKKLCNLITQSRLLSIFNVMDIKKCESTIENLQIGIKKVISVPSTEVAYRAFKLMIEKGVNGLAVLNRDGEIVGNISISDIKLIGWNADYWNLLGFPIVEYLHQLSNHPENVIRDYNFWTLDRPQNVVLSCKLEDKLSTVIRKMCFFKVHRIYLLSKDKKPIGVIAMHDILRELILLTRKIECVH